MRNSWDSMNICYLVFKVYFDTLSEVGYLVIKQLNINSWFMSIAQINHYKPDQNSSSLILTWGIWIFPWLFHSLWATVRSLHPKTILIKTNNIYSWHQPADGVGITVVYQPMLPTQRRPSSNPRCFFPNFLPSLIA